LSHVTTIEIDPRLAFPIASRHEKVESEQNLFVPNSRWLAYAAAGAASTLVGSHSAEAEIHYSGVVNARLGFGDVVPLRHSARLKFNDSPSTYVGTFRIDGAAVSNAFCGYEGRFGTYDVSRLTQGVVISNCNFLSRGGVFLTLFPYSGGPWFGAGIGFIGFRFNNGAGMQYGWARLKLPGPPYFFPRLKLLDYAWGDPGDQVKTGQTNSAGDRVEALPDQGSLGLLALGGAGLMAWRRRRSKAL
jgi:hypothetical protein